MIDLILSLFSVGVSLANTASMVIMYTYFIKSVQGAILSVRADKDGDVEITDLV